MAIYLASEVVQNHGFRQREDNKNFLKASEENGKINQKLDERQMTMIREVRECQNKIA